MKLFKNLCNVVPPRRDGIDVERKGNGGIYDGKNF